MNIKIKKSELLLTLLSTAIALILGLLLIRWFQPSLLGVPSDMVLVRSSEEVTAYYETIFRKQDFLTNEFILKDPIVKGRARQLFPDMGTMGPNDLLGFRNRAVPNDSDIIIIGDSQTYGNNAHMLENWPHYFAELLPNGVSAYSMATGGWGAVQYYYAAAKAPIFTPKVIIVAFYTGNDPLETFSLIYGSEIWHEFIPVKNLDKNDVPMASFPAPESEQWSVTFSDGVKTVFTPKLRHSSNVQHPAIDAAYQAMINIAKKIVTIVKENGIHVVFTIIPTKELVFLEKIRQEEIEMDPSYRTLVNDERNRIAKFSTALKAIKGADYIDVVAELQRAALNRNGLYPLGVNGHPLAEGYKVIGSTIARGLNDMQLITVFDGLAAILSATDQIVMLVYIEEGQYWIVELSENITGGVEVKQTIKKRDLAGFQYMGHKSIDELVPID